MRRQKLLYEIQGVIMYKEKKKTRAVYVRLPFEVWQDLALGAVLKGISFNVLVNEILKKELTNMKSQS